MATASKTASPTVKCQVYTVEEAAEILGLTPTTIRRLILRKKLPRVPFIRHIRIPCWAVDKMATCAP